MEVGRTEDATGEYPRTQTRPNKGHACRPATASTDVSWSTATGVAHPSGSRDLRNSHAHSAHAIELYLLCVLRCSHQNNTMHIQRYNAFVLRKDGLGAGGLAIGRQQSSAAKGALPPSMRFPIEIFFSQCKLKRTTVITKNDVPRPLHPAQCRLHLPIPFPLAHYLDPLDLSPLVINC